MPLRFLYFFLNLVILSAMGCKPEPVPELVKFVFVMPVHITPGADTVNRGDTLWLSVDFSDSLFDLRSNRRYQIKGQDLKLNTSVVFHKLLGPDQASTGFTQGFTVVNQIGQLLPGGATFRRFEPIYDGQRYRARIGIIPHFMGIYTLGMLNALDTPLPMPFLPIASGPDGKPKHAVLDDLYHVVNDGNVHFALQQQHSRVASLRPDATERTVYYEQKGAFTFVVR